MLKVFNVSALTSKQRFLKALLFGTLASIVLLVVYVFIQDILPFEFFYVYLAFGYAIGMVIQKTGHGVQVKFSILAAVLCFLVIFLGDFLIYFYFLFYPVQFPDAIGEILGFYFKMDFNTMHGLAFRVGAIVMAYYYARVV